jgi:hypothetical protein
MTKPYISIAMNSQPFNITEDGTYEWNIILNPQGIPADLPENFQVIYSWTGDQPISGVSEEPKRLGDNGL